MEQQGNQQAGEEEQLEAEEVKHSITRPPTMGMNTSSMMNQFQNQYPAFIR